MSLTAFLIKRGIPPHVDLIEPLEELAFNAGMEDSEDDEERDRLIGEIITNWGLLSKSKKKVLPENVQAELRERLLDIYEESYNNGLAFRD